jgi:hypothetical protein
VGCQNLEKCLVMPGFYSFIGDEKGGIAEEKV